MDNPAFRPPGLLHWPRGILFAAAVVTLAGLVAACGSTSPPLTGGMGPRTSALPFRDTGSRSGSQPGAQVITYQVVGASQGALGPDGRHHDTFTATRSAEVVAGRSVTVEITNYDDMPHSFTIPELGIDRLVPGAVGGSPGTATFTFTPTASGTYRWFCALPCDTDNGGWAMGSYASMGGGMMGGGGSYGGERMGPGVDGFMAGYISVTPG